MESNGLVVCQNRKYMAGKILSPKQKCHGCPHEVSDLFSGTSGKQVWLWYCNFLPGK